MYILSHILLPAILSASHRCTFAYFRVWIDSWRVWKKILSWVLCLGWNVPYFFCLHTFFLICKVNGCMWKLYANLWFILRANQAYLLYHIFACHLVMTNFRRCCKRVKNIHHTYIFAKDVKTFTHFSFFFRLYLYLDT